MRFPQGRAKALTLSYDDGVEQDIKLMEILDKNGIKCTFNINSGRFAAEDKVYPEGTIHRIMSKSKALNTFKDSGHEVAVHGYSHPFLESLPPATAAWDIINDRRCLEAEFDTVIRGMAYPYGTTSDTVVEILKNSGIVYARTTVSTEKFDIPKDWLRMPATCHHNCKSLMTLAERFVAMDVPRHPKMFYLWGHSYEFEQDNSWEIIEKFSEYVGGKEDIWYATNIEIYDYVQAYNRLEWAADISKVHNPSAISVWVNTGLNNSSKRTVEIKPGETVKLF